MSIYRCNGCERHFDNDYFPCEEDPNNGCAVLCAECHDDAEDKILEEGSKLAAKARQYEIGERETALSLQLYGEGQ